MSSNISGNVGIAATGISVRCFSTSGVATPVSLYGYSDSSGNFTFTGLAAGTYRLVADTRDLTGTYAGYIYRSPVEVLLDGTNNASGVNLRPTAPSASNATYPV